MHCSMDDCVMYLPRLQRSVAIELAGFSEASLCQHTELHQHLFILLQLLGYFVWFAVPAVTSPKIVTARARRRDDYPSSVRA